MTRRPAFWVVFGLLGAGGATLAIRLFTVALPVVSLDISMDREGAIAEATDLAAMYGWGPTGARSAASFGQVDAEVQTYVELEGGGRAAYQSLIDEGIYQPYQWRVRRFAEDEVVEGEVRFTPSGEPYGFRLRLAEDDPGEGNLEEDEARALAESEAGSWGIDISDYRPFETSEQERPGGRVDHTFVYEHGRTGVAEARFRLRLVVAGDRASEVTRFVYVPEAFGRRYADMRSTNDAIALVAQWIFIVVYILLGAGVGTALLLRRRWIEWRAALAWGAVVAILFGANTFNALPLAWMGYDTAVSAGTFVLQNVAVALATALLGAPLLAFFFLAGESLGRAAFPEHLQQWRFWAPDVARSNTALGLTVAAYLLVGIQVGYVVLFYLGTARLDGWWSPADALVQPDLLATYLPWLQAVAISLFAAMWEESVFRAVPIACAALLGARYGRRGAWVTAAVVLQAVVFAAGHANYPQQPPYARVVELTFPALMWGIVYVRYGLVPTILAHFLYDLSLISSVLFASDARFDQAVIILVGLVPLVLVLRARRARGVTPAPPEWAYNRAWSPPEHESPGQAVSDPLEGAATGPNSGPPTAEVRRLPTRAILAGGALGAVLWVGGFVSQPPPPRLEIGRAAAIDAAREELARRGHDIEGFTASAVTGSGRGDGHRYVYQEVGPEAFQDMVGTFLAPPQWIVRFVDWDAPPEERVEELVVNVLSDGRIRGLTHTLPEARPGARLDEDSARALARAALPPGTWEAVGAEQTAHDARVDWRFTWRDPAVLTEVAGEARATATVVGDEVTGVRRFVDVPEEWTRAYVDATTRLTLAWGGLIFLVILLMGAGVVTAVVTWSRTGLPKRLLVTVGAVAGVGMLGTFVNQWPATTAIFQTAQPYDFQAFGAASGLVIFALVGAAAIGLLAALAGAWAAPVPPIRGDRTRVATGISLGLLFAGVQRAIATAAGGLPPIPGYGEAASRVPVLDAAVGVIAPYCLVIASLGVLAVAHRRFENRPLPQSATVMAILAIAAVTVPAQARTTLVPWLAAGLVSLPVLWLIVRSVGSDPRLAPLVAATVPALDLLETALVRAYPAAPVGTVLALATIALIAWRWPDPGDPERLPAQAGARSP